MKRYYIVGVDVEETEEGKRFCAVVLPLTVGEDVKALVKGFAGVQHIYFYENSLDANRAAAFWNKFYKDNNIYFEG